MPLQSGALRDALAALNEHTMGGQPFTALSLQARIGVSQAVAVERMRGLVARGWATVTTAHALAPEYRITDAGRAMLS